MTGKKLTAEQRYQQSLAEFRYQQEMKAALKTVNQRLRSLWAIKRDRIKRGVFPLPLDEAAELATRLGYAENTMSWFKAISKLTRIPSGQVKREFLGDMEPADDDDDILSVILDDDDDDDFDDAFDNI